MTDIRDALIGLNDAIDLYWNEGRTDGQVKNICYWQFKAKEALASPAQTVPNRHTVIETAIRDYCRRQSSASVEGGRIYYAGLSITDLVNDIEAALSVSSTTRCTCAAMGKENIRHARNCPAVSSTDGKA